MATKSSTIYDVVYSWKRSPEVWGYMAKICLISLATGAILAGLAMGNGDKAAHTGKADQAKVCGSAQGK